MKESEIKDSYIKQAEELKVKGRLKDAERYWSPAHMRIIISFSA